jgi:hypothetical protein
MANIIIDIAAEFTGNKAFKSAETSTDKLTKNIKNMAKTLGVAFSATAVLNYAKASVKAAAADEKAQKQLALALKNVGLGRDVAISEAFIQKLQSEFGVVDDKLRPAYQQLAVATGNTAQSQKLLQIALDISASTGRDLASVTGAISKAYLGNNTALGKLGVGISKADLKAKSFDDIMNQLSDTFAGSATASANTFQGSMDKLSVASANVQEIIGKGIIESLKILSEDSTVSDLATGMEEFATAISESIQGLAILIAQIKSIPKIPGGGSGAIFDIDKLFKFTGIAMLRKIFDAANKGSANDPTAGLAHLAELEAKYTAATLGSSKKLTAEELKQLKAKQLKAAIDKANLALGKGSNVFDMEKIQLAAAEKNAAEQLGKVTSQAQLLQITNDLARLEVKQSILALEDAIASKDVAAITNATNKLNADLAVLGALNGQKVKLTEIDDILKAILPKDLINMANLDAAIAKLLSISKMVVSPTIAPTGTGTGTSTGKALTPAEIEALLILGRTVPIVPDSSGGVGYSSTAGNYASSGFPGSAMGYGGSSGGNTIIVNTGIGDPNAIAEAIDQVLQDAVSRGTLRVA